MSETTKGQTWQVMPGTDGPVAGDALRQPQVAEGGVGAAPDAGHGVRRYPTEAPDTDEKAYGAAEFDELEDLESDHATPWVPLLAGMAIGVGASLLIQKLWSGDDDELEKIETITEVTVVGDPYLPADL